MQRFSGLWVCGDSEYRLSYLEKVGSSGISVIYFARSTGNVVRRRIQWVQKMVVFWTIFFSAIGICKGCGDSVPDIYQLRNAEKMWKFSTVCKIVISVLPIVGLVGASNLSTAVIILGIAVILVFVASPKYGQFAWMVCLGCAFMGIFLAMESYRLERLQIWQHPEKYEKGYQTLQGLYAIGSGGLFGRDLEAVSRNSDLYRKRRMI